MNLETKIICRNKFLGRCPECKIDFDKQHHPNNYDCPRFRPMKMNYFEVIDGENKYENKDRHI